MLDFLKKFNAENLIDMQKVMKIEREFYLVPDYLKKQINKIKKQPVFAGSYIGKQKKEFNPSIYLLELLAKEALTVTVNKDGAWLFICKRDLWGKSIVDSKGEISIGSLVFVLNENKEVLGYGEVVAELTAKKLCIRNLFDIGDLIRRERKK